MEQTFSLCLINSRATSVEFFLEPWGENYEMAAGATFVLTFKTTEKAVFGTPEVIWDENSVTVYADEGMTCTLFAGREELGAGLGERTQVPAYPSSVTRELVS